MQTRWKVNSVSQEDVSTDVTVNGNTVTAKVPGLVVELIGLNSPSVHTHRFIPADMGAALVLFVEGAEIDLTFSAAA